MKKLYFLTFLLVASMSYGQNLVSNGGFENWTDGVPDGYTTIDFSTDDLTENTNTNFITEGSSSASVNVLTQSQGNTDIRQTVSLTGGSTYTMSLDVYATNNEARARIFNGNDFNLSVYSDETLLNQWQTISFEYTASSDEDFDYGMRFYDISANWVSGSLFYVDNFQIIETSSSPAISVVSPVDGATLTTTAVDIELSVQNFAVAAEGNGDGYIEYSVDGGTTIDKFDLDNISLSDLSEGAHTVNLELVDDNGNALDPAATTSVSFTIATVNQVATVSDLRAGTIGEVYELSGEAIITYIVTDNGRNQKYIQDATAGILIDDQSGVLSTTFNIGDGISGLQGQLNEFNGILQFTPVANVASASSTGTTITPEVISLADFLANGETYESELIKIDNVIFDVTGQFEDNTNYNLSATGLPGDPTTIARVTFGDEDLVGASIPTTASSVIGLGGEFNGEYQILPRYASDVEGATLAINDLNAANFEIYPNPVSNGFVNITSSSNDAITVSVFDILGKNVITKTLNANRLNVSALQTGVYILKISQNDAITTKKLVVK
ncbi:T9SS type A sorting domain-containing protein [Sediminibacter sp. Hel_I_10]|uniref:T9SS type A sorting domain-containing protein n=1 Tax=Sediminibacter sp. Hel_I_10 TaxID=1392490 RepID=UPI00047947C1|nr:T9SS type A sorting domain-containing protein [Sediminibacter sp. Hel_I_10]